MSGHFRYKGFKNAVEYALDDTLKKFTLEKMSECYPGLDKDALEFVRIQLLEAWKNRACLEFDKMYKDRDLEVKLDELDDIIEDSTERMERNDEDSRLFILNAKPEELVRNMVVSERKIANDKLKLKLDELMNLNQELKSKMQDIRTQTNENLSSISYLYKELDALGEFNNELSDSDFEELIDYTTNEIYMNK